VLIAEEKVQSLAEGWFKALEVLVFEYATQPDAGGLTPSMCLW